MNENMIQSEVKEGKIELFWVADIATLDLGGKKLEVHKERG